MRKLIVILFSLICPLSNIYGFGTGFSFFFPESGSLSVESCIEGSFKLVEDYLFLPVGLTFNKVSGMNAENVPAAVNPWFYGDTLQLYALLNLNIPVKNMYFTVFGGGILNWNACLNTLNGNIDRDIAAEKGYTLVLSDFDYQSGIGFGYEFGAGLGFRIKRLSFDLTVAYVNVKSRLSVTGTYQYSGGPTIQTAEFATSDTARLRLVGYKVGFNINLAI